MAEEKKTTTKSSTTKKETIEEVKVEKRFCTKCGKELGENEVCICTSTATVANTSINTDEILNACKGFLNKIVSMYKTPAITLKEEVSKNDVKSALIMLAVIAVTYGLYIMGGFSSIISMISGFAGGDVNELVEIPYFKIFIYMTLIYFVVSFIPILITYAVARITGNKDFDIKKSISLYAYSNAPLVFTNLLMTILYLLDILTGLGAILACIVGIVCFFNYILGYLNITNIAENKKSYALTGIIVSWAIVAVIAVALFAGSLLTDVVKDFGFNQNNGIYDSFNW